MEREQLYELIRCGLNETLTVRPVNKGRRNAARALAREGYLIPRNRIGDPAFKPEWQGSVHNVALTLTDRGRAHLLGLNAADFEGQLWPNRADIEQMQARLKPTRADQSLNDPALAQFFKDLAEMDNDQGDNLPNTDR